MTTKLKLVATTHAPIPAKVECDMVAAEIAIKARAECIRSAAKHRVSAQTFPDGHDGKFLQTELADQFEKRAREWERKAERARYPIPDNYVRHGILPRVKRECGDDAYDEIVFQYTGSTAGGVRHVDYDDPYIGRDELVTIHNACVDALEERYFDPTA